jgi:hypothetical protein
MSGHAESAPESGGLADLASFLSDTPETDPKDDEEAQAEDSPEESTDEADTEDEASDQLEESEGDEPEEEKPEAPAPDLKIKVPVLDEHGKETGETEEVSAEELAKSYTRQADYTRKTQALAEREHQAVQFLTTKHDEITKQYAEKTELVLSAASRILGIRSSAEMAQLARDDPAAWVAESQRQAQINEFIGSLDNEIKSERTQAQKRADEARAAQVEQQKQKSWSELEKAKIDEPKLRNIYTSVMKQYGYKPEEMSGINDYRLVLALQDAVAYRELKAKAPEVTKKAQDAPRLPNKQATPAQDRQRKELDNRFKSGRAKLNDLAAFLR